MPANTSIFTDADGSLTLSVPTGTEGEAAQNLVLGPYELLTVGRVSDVHVEVHSEIHVFREVGRRLPSELRAGSITISGTIGRAYINGALIKLLLGEAAFSSSSVMLNAGWRKPPRRVCATRRRCTA